MAAIRATVGVGEVNLSQDAVTIQVLLHRKLAGFWPSWLLPIDGLGNSDVTVRAIKTYQGLVLTWRRPSGRVEPGDITLRSLSQSEPQEGVRLTGRFLPAGADKVLKEIVLASGLATAHVASVARTPADQARIMFDSIVLDGIEAAYKLYRSPGDSVIKVYEDNKAKASEVVIALMEAKIREVGPGNVSQHCADTRYVFDVAPSSIRDARRFVKAATAHAAVARFLKPPEDPRAYHIEIRKDSPLTWGQHPVL